VNITLRPYTPADCEALAELFYRTVHTVNARDYTEEQLNVWASGHPDLAAWNRSFLAHYTVIAEAEGQPAGFGDIDKTGYLDHLFVHHAFQRRGVASAICGELERSVPNGKIVTHASVTAKGFFERRGYHVIREQLVERQGVLLKNYVMERPPRDV